MQKLFFVLILVSWTEAHAQNDTYFEAIILEGIEAGNLLDEAKRMSWRLQIPWSPETVADPLTQNYFLGEVISAVKDKGGKYKLTGFLGLTETMAQRTVDKAKQHYKNARVNNLGALERLQYSYRYKDINLRLFILHSSKSFAEAQKFAQDISKKSGQPYKTRGLVWEGNRLQFPKDFKEKTLRGVYTPRFDNACGHFLTACQGCWGDQCISVEKSDYYPDLEPGLFLVVSGVDYGISYNFLKPYRRIVKDGYYKKTRVHPGIKDADMGTTSRE